LEDLTVLQDKYISGDLSTFLLKCRVVLSDDMRLLEESFIIQPSKKLVLYIIKLLLDVIVIIDLAVVLNGLM